jgi:hypothetical protein
MQEKSLEEDKIWPWKTVRKTMRIKGKWKTVRWTKLQAKTQNEISAQNGLQSSNRYQRQTSHRRKSLAGIAARRHKNGSARTTKTWKNENGSGGPKTDRKRISASSRQSNQEMKTGEKHFRYR